MNRSTKSGWKAWHRGSLPGLGSARGAQRRWRARPRRLRAEALEARQLLSVTAQLLVDLNLDTQSAGPLEIAQVNSLVYFSANDGDSGFELWQTDGTSSGTRLVRDIHPGYKDSRPHDFLNVAGTLYFQADDGETGFELWKSNGTSSGTVLVRDIRPGIEGRYARGLVDVGGSVFFSANDGVNGYELWKSDGSSSGTQLVRNIHRGEGGSSYPFELTNVGGALYFAANDGTRGTELWRSNGTSTGTVLVKDIATGAAASNPGSLTERNGQLYFFAQEERFGRELWTSDGTSSGTQLVKDIAADEADGVWFELVNAAGTLYFAGLDGAHGQELWKSNGTSSGTELVSDILPGSDSSQIASLTVVGSNVFFAANDGTHGFELWKSDGSSSGTLMVREIFPSAPYVEVPRELTAVGNLLYFQGNDGTFGGELWRSDGSSSGTYLVRDLRSGPGSGLPLNLFNAAGTLYFGANDGTRGFELWKSNGSSTGTQRVVDVNAWTDDSTPVVFTAAAGTTFFLADDGVHGTELWKTDGSSSGTQLVRDVRPGEQGPFNFFSSPRPLIEAGGRLFFQADDGTHGRELWASDGTSSGTQLVQDIHPGDSLWGGSINLQGVLLFAANDGASGVELWRSDGTSSGTWMVKEIQSGSAGSYPDEFAVLGNQVYFSANNGTQGFELWKTDGTSSGTQLVREIRPGDASSIPRQLISVGAKLYFTANDGIHGDELWSSDGSSSGTQLVFDIGNGFPFSSYPNQLVPLGNRLYFAANDGTHGEELWSSDGTSTGTQLVCDIRPDADESFLRSLTAAGGRLYFHATDGVSGYELWTSNGTSKGTQLVRDIQPGGNSNPFYLTDVGGRLYFRANDGDFGEELWTSDGTSSGTVLVQDIFPGLPSANPISLFNLGGRLLFGADDGPHGWEPWLLDEACVLIGDANGDGNVGTADYAIWAATFGQTGPDLAADFDGNEDIGAGDYALWAANFGKSCPPAETTVDKSVQAANLVDQPDWLGGAFTEVYPPYVGSGYTDGQIGDGTYTSRDVDLFAFDTLNDSVLWFETSSQPGQSPTDTLLRLFDADGTELAYDDDGGAEPGCSLLQVSLPTGGRYYLGVSGYNNRYYDPNMAGTGAIGQTGPYRLTFTVESPDDYAGETVTTAVSVGHDIGVDPLYTAANFYGSLGETAADDVDLFTFSAFQGTQVDFETGAWASPNPPDTFLRLFDEDGTVLTFDDDGGEGALSRIADFVAPYTGRYYLGVSGYPNSLYDPVTGTGRAAGSVGDYVLHSHFTEWPDLGDTRATAVPIGGVGAWAFQISEKLGNTPDSGSQDVDLIALWGVVGDQFSLETRANTVPGAQGVDTVLRLFDAGGNQVAFSDDALGIYSQIDYTLPATGTYYLGVSGYPNSVYSLANADATTGRVGGAVGDYLLEGGNVFEAIDPTVALDYPPADLIVAGEVTSIGTVYDANLNWWELRVGPTPSSQPYLIASDTVNQSGAALGTWDTASVVDGNYYLTLKATDLRGNESLVTRHLVVDNTLPIAVISSPAAGATVPCRVPVIGTANDANFGSWTLAYSTASSGRWTTISTSNTPVIEGTFAVWDSRAVANGNVYLRLVVTDQADNSQEFIRQIVVDNWPLIGDANRDCNVGAADYAIWAAQFGQSGAGLTADFDCSGGVGAGDYALWAANFARSCPPTLPSAGAAPLAASRESPSRLWERVQTAVARRLDPAAVDRLFSVAAGRPTIREPHFSRLAT